MKLSKISVSISVATLTLISTSLPLNAETKDSVILAQVNDEKPRRNYIGVGGNIGVSGDETAIGEGGFVTVSRFAFADNFSLHNGIIFGDNTTSTIALTFDLPYEDPQSGRTLFTPFIGGGIALRTGDEWQVDPLVSGGVDVPISRDFTGTVRVNVSFPNDDTDIGLLFGVGYNFSLF